MKKIILSACAFSTLLITLNIAASSELVLLTSSTSSSTHDTHPAAIDLTQDDLQSLSDAKILNANVKAFLKYIVKKSEKFSGAQKGSIVRRNLNFLLHPDHNGSGGASVKMLGTLCKKHPLICSKSHPYLLCKVTKLLTQAQTDEKPLPEKCATALMTITTAAFQLFQNQWNDTMRTVDFKRKDILEMLFLSEKKATESTAPSQPSNNDDFSPYSFFMHTKTHVSDTETKLKELEKKANQTISKMLDAIGESHKPIKTFNMGWALAQIIKKIRPTYTSIDQDYIKYISSSKQDWEQDYSNIQYATALKAARILELIRTDNPYTEKLFVPNKLSEIYCQDWENIRLLSKKDLDKYESESSLPFSQTIIKIEDAADLAVIETMNIKSSYHLFDSINLAAALRLNAKSLYAESLNHYNSSTHKPAELLRGSKKLYLMWKDIGSTEEGLNTYCTYPEAASHYRLSSNHMFSLDNTPYEAASPENQEFQKFVNTEPHYGTSPDPLLVKQKPEEATPHSSLGLSPQSSNLYPAAIIAALITLPSTIAGIILTLKKQKLAEQINTIAVRMHDKNGNTLLQRLMKKNANVDHIIEDFNLSKETYEAANTLHKKRRLLRYYQLIAGGSVAISLALATKLCLN